MDTTLLPPAAPSRRPAISPARDQFQSWLMVSLWSLTVLPFVALVASVHALNAWQDDRMLQSQPMHAIYISVFLTLLVIALRAATPAAAATGGIICFCMALAASSTTQHLHQTLLPALILLFLLTYSATRLGHARKLSLGIAESLRGRQTRQIIANLGAASFAAMAQTITSAFVVGALAALAEATADTLASELGPLLPGPTILINTFRRVPRGTDGGVSLGGTLCAIAGAAAITWAGISALHLGWLEAKIAFLAAIFGLLVDSVLGATLERRGYIGNDMVNLVSSGLTVIIATSFALLLLNYL
jgi:uncharacterized protein (TIGR00297 family)